MSAKKILRKWLRHIESSTGEQLETGLTWDQENGWRVYQRIGDKALAMAPAEARKIGAIYDKLGKLPEWRHAAADLANTLGGLKELADEADAKNRDGSIPPDAALHQPAWGSA